MNWLRRFQFGQRRDELQEEIDAHLRMATKDRIERGESESEAWQAARREFGNIPLVEDVTRGTWGSSWLEQVVQDIRFAFRQLRKSPGFTAAVVCTLGLGIGVNIALFSILNGMLLRPLPVKEPQRLISFSYESTNGWDNGFSYPVFAEIQKQVADSVSSSAAFDFSQGGIAVDGKAVKSLQYYVTGEFFPMLGIAPALGRLITPADCSGAGNPVVVLGYSFWKTRVGGDPRIIGRAVLVNGHPATVVGVAPAGFHGMIGVLNADAYLPLGNAVTDGTLPRNSLSDPVASNLTVIGQVKTDLSVGRLQPAMDLLGTRLMRDFPGVYKNIRFRATHLGPMGPTSGSGDFLAPVIAVFFSLTSLILILACVNVANLILVRATARQREMAVRFALGAGRTRLVRQLFTETLALGLMGCVGGIALGAIANRALPYIRFGSDLPFSLDFPFDWRIYTYAVVMALATGLLVGVFPALRLPRAHLNQALQDDGRSVTGRGQRLRVLLSAAQVACSLVLLIVAGLFIRSFENVRGADLGFEPSHVLNLSFNPHDAGLTESQGRDLQNRLLERVQSLPGVRSAALAVTVPMGYMQRFGSDLTATDSRVHTQAGRNSVSPEYFQTMGIPLLRGRTFQDSDAQNSTPVAIINQALAGKLWPNQDAIGRTLAVDSRATRVEVVGIVKNSRTSHITENPSPYFYLPLTQSYESAVTMQVRTATSPREMTQEILQAIHGVAPQLPVSNVQTMEQATATMNGSMSFQVGATLAAGLGGLGLILSIVGLYGVISYAAARRTAEIGLRIALGAKRRDILFLVFRQGILIVAIGIAFGSLGATLLARLMSGMLYRVSTTDPVTFAAVSFILSLVAITACLIPARRAAMVDPMQALRTN
jgi:predicted permease